MTSTVQRLNNLDSTRTLLEDLVVPEDSADSMTLLLRSEEEVVTDRLMCSKRYLALHLVEGQVRPDKVHAGMT